MSPAVDAKIEGALIDNIEAWIARVLTSQTPTTSLVEKTKRAHPCATWPTPSLEVSIAKGEARAKLEAKQGRSEGPR